MSTFPPLPKAEDIRLIVSDVDGTLLDSTHALPEHSPTYIVLRRLRAAHPDLPIVLSTGKPYPVTARLRAALDLHAFPAVHLNGNVLHALGGAILSQTGFSTETVLKVYEAARADGMSLFLYDTERPWQVLPCATPGEAGVPWDAALRAYGADLQSLGRAEEAMARVKDGTMQVVKMSVCEAPAYLPHVRSVLSKFPPEAFSTTQAIPFMVELIPAGHDKGTALALLLAHLNAHRPWLEHIMPAHVLAFGDGGNDVPLFAAAGMSVAMANAMPEALAAARWRTGSNDEGGVGMFLEKVFFPDT